MNKDPQTAPVPDRGGDLAGKIRTILAEGIDLGERAADFIDGTFSDPTPARLVSILSEENSDRDTLAELIFSPDEEMQVRIEPFLAGSAFGPGDEALAARLLRSDPPRVRVRLPRGRGEFVLPLPDSVVDGFIARLKIRARPDRKIAETIDRHAPAALQSRLAVRFRNIRFAYGADAVSVLCRFLKRYDPERADYLDALDYLMEFLGVLEPEDDIDEKLSHRKRRCLQHLQMAARQAERLLRHNVETLILSGERLPHIDPEAVAREIRLIDALSRALFDRVAPIRIEGRELDLGEFQGPEDIQRLIDIFSRL